MSRRKSCDYTKKGLVRKIPLLDKAPHMKNLQDLIDTGLSVKSYRGIDCVMLWRITPYLEELQNLIGMEDLKQTIFLQVSYYMQGFHKRNSKNEYMHTVIYGPPGSGKTTVAQIVANIYKELGILSSNGKFKIARREDFIAGYLGQTATKTAKLLASCIGGVLFIDEAYALAPGKEDSDSFAKEAIDTLNSFLSEHSHEFCCIIAGYEEAINTCLFGTNAGLRSRFPWIHRIGLYKAEDLFEMFKRECSLIDWELIPKENKVIELFKNNIDLFPNTGRDVENFMTKVKMEHAFLLISGGEGERFKLSFEDLTLGMKSLRASFPEIEPTDSPPQGMYI